MPRLQLLLAAAIVATVAALFWIGAAVTARLDASTRRGADPATALNLVPERPNDYPVRVEWLPDDRDAGREMEPWSRNEIEAAYVRAWLQWNLALARERTTGLDSYFTGPALAGVTEAVTGTLALPTPVEQVDTAHQLRLHFYSADGSIVSFTDETARVALLAGAAGDHPLLLDEARTYHVVMLLEDGNWRVRHWLRGAPAPINTIRPASLEPGPWAGVNYYRPDASWEQFWRDFDGPRVSADLARMGQMGLNSARVFVPYELFGAGDVAPTRLAQLGDLLDRAAAAEIRLVVTLFDFRSDYSLLLWPQSDRHLEAILDAAGGHPALLAWDLKNEPDLDFPAQGESRVVGWLRHTAGLARQHDPSTPLTIGWSRAGAAATLLDEVDIVSFHHYGPVASLASELPLLRERAGGRPVMLTEFGLPVWNSPVFPHGHSEEEQAAYYAGVLQTLRREGVAGYFAWTLYDFESVPDTVARWPWERGPQSRLGVLRGDGSARPAASLLAPDATLDAAAPAPWRRWTKPFWRTVFAISLLVVVGAALRRRRPA